MMIKEKAYAKINLTLDVVRKRTDGFHDLKMIMMPIELHDTLEFEIADQLILESNVDIEDNLILKAAEKLKEKYKVNKGAHIKLSKIIPIGAGLGGGSANIAATLRGLNQLWELNLEINELEDIALDLGSDTLFCLYNQSAYVYGRGENMLYIQSPKIQNIYLVTSYINVSTKLIFQKHILKFKRNRFDKVFKLYLNEKYNTFFKKTYNVLLDTTLEFYPELRSTYQVLKRINKNIYMSGSGSTLFIMTFDENNVLLEEKFEKYNLNYIKTKPKT